MFVLGPRHTFDRLARARRSQTYFQVISDVPDFEPGGVCQRHSQNDCAQVKSITIDPQRVFQLDRDPERCRPPTQVGFVQRCLNEKNVGDVNSVFGPIRK